MSIQVADCGCVAIVKRGGIKTELCPLHSAAPDLLEACKVAVQCCPCSLRERESGHLTDCFAPQLKEAIEKAEAR